MKIIEVNIPNEKSSILGLKNININKIDEMVIIVGKNGSGKSRLLKIIKQQTGTLEQLKRLKKESPSIIENLTSSIINSRKQIEDYKANQNTTENPRELKYAHDIKRLENDISNWENELKIQNLHKNNKLPIVTNEQDKELVIIDFIPKQIDLLDWSTQSKRDWERKAETASKLGTSQLNYAALPLIQSIQDSWLNVTHPELNYTPEIKDLHIKNYEKLNKIITTFFDCELGRDQKGHATLFNKPIAQAELSEGQKIILQLCIAIYAQGESIEDCIIFLDEPENHLHAKTAIELIETIKNHNRNGQLWIATHSLPILSYFSKSKLIYIDNGKIENAGRKPELILSGLIGNQENIGKIRDFTSLPAELATSRFAFECLLPPESVLTDSQDAQVKQFYEQLKKLWSKTDKLKVLEYGAGKGRVISNLSQNIDSSIDKLDYYAFDIFDDDKEICIENISNHYPDANERYFNNIDDIRVKYNDNHFDTILLCNVLHEIPVKEWLDTFKKISTLLKHDGHLLIIEDCRIPTGELPNKNGFIVYNTLHLKKLFKISNDENFISHDARFDSKDQRGRLMAHTIPCQYLKSTDVSSIINSLNELKNTAINEIKTIRNSDNSYKTGLAHGFWVQQLANSELNLNEYGN